MFKLMVDYLRRPVVHEAFFKKYASKKFLKGTTHLKHRNLTFANMPCSFYFDATMGQKILSALPNGQRPINERHQYFHSFPRRERPIVHILIYHTFTYQYLMSFLHLDSHRMIKAWMNLPVHDFNVKWGVKVEKHP